MVHPAIIPLLPGIYSLPVWKLVSKSNSNDIFGESCTGIVMLCCTYSIQAQVEQGVPPIVRCCYVLSHASTAAAAAAVASDLRKWAIHSIR